MKRRIIAVAVALPVVYLNIFGVQAAIAFSHARSYAEQLTGEYDKSLVQDSCQLGIRCRPTLLVSAITCSKTSTS
jgi:hypothetical protein